MEGKKVVKQGDYYLGNYMHCNEQMQQCCRPSNGDMLWVEICMAVDSTNMKNIIQVWKTLAVQGKSHQKNGLNFFIVTTLFSDLITLDLIRGKKIHIYITYIHLLSLLLYCNNPCHYYYFYSLFLIFKGNTLKIIIMFYGQKKIKTNFQTNCLNGILIYLSIDKYIE